MKMPVRKVKHFQILGRAFRTLKDRVYSPNRFLRRFKQKPTSNNVPQFIRGAKKREKVGFFPRTIQCRKRGAIR